MVTSALIKAVLTAKDYSESNFRISNRLFMLIRSMDRGRGGGGGGQKTKCRTPSPKLEELIESITNMLLFLAGGGVGGNVTRCQCFGEGSLP